MSSIIDALKKSDNDRNTGDKATVNQIKFSDEPPQKSRKGFWILVIFLLLVASGVFAWQQGWHHSIINKVNNILKPSEPSNSAPTNPKTVATPNNKNLNEAENKTSAKPNNKSANKLVPPKANDIKAKTAATKQQAQDKVKKQTDAAKEQTNTDTIPAVEKVTDSEDVRANGAEPQEEIVPIKSTKKATEPTHNKALEPELKQNHLLVHQIPFEIRKNIPPIKLNIHIYDPEPENRMVLLNGVKYSVGDLIEQLVEVKEITQEGVVLKFENVEFLVPK